ncbi:MAG: single-stranded DNA-binding protein [Prevotellaceae bacterium]|jgi:single-strand DNA-binding protein|nr:single-stranded DNA-binding protein [Prevotellaceae bacterium]
MSSVNKVILVGNVGKDPDVRYLDNNVSVANFTLATTERGYTAQNGTVIPDKTEWHNIVAWRGLADISERFIKKGSQIYVEGKLRTRSWDDKEGNKRYVTEIYADNIQLLGNRRQENSEGGNNTPLAKPVPVTAEQQPAATQSAPPADSADDLPF